MIPKPQRRNAAFRQKLFPCGIALHAFGMTVLRAVQFHGELRVRAVEIQNVFSNRVLPSEFETGKTPVPQRPPKRLFVLRLIMTQLAGDFFQAHAGMMFFAWKISSSSPHLTPSPR